MIIFMQISKRTTRGDQKFPQYFTKGIMCNSGPIHLKGAGPKDKAPPGGARCIYLELQGAQDHTGSLK